MKRFLPLLAVSAMFVAAPVFAADEVSAVAIPSAEEVIAQAPPSAAVTTQRARLNLSDSQLEQLRALKDKYFADNAVKKAQLSVLKNSLRSEMTKTTVNRSAVLGIQNQINALQNELSNSRISMMLDAQTVFTAEQREQMHSRMLRHGGGFGGGHHKRGGHGGGCGGGKHGGFRGHGGPGGPGGPGFRAEGPQGPAGFEHQQAEMPDAPDMDGMEG